MTNDLLVLFLCLDVTIAWTIWVYLNIREPLDLVGWSVLNKKKQRGKRR